MILASLMGCDRKTQITNLINDYVTAYNERDIDACLNLYFITSDKKDSEKDPNNTDSLQYYFDLHPSSPTYTIIAIGDRLSYGGYSLVNVEIKNIEDGEYKTYSCIVTRTNEGFLGYFEGWSLLYSSLPGSPESDIYY